MDIQDDNNRIELLSQQNNAISHLLRWKVGALFMEAGTGKTRVACELINAVKDIDYVLWVGPYQTIHRKDESSVVREVQKWGINCPNVDFIGIESIQSSDRIYDDIREKLGKVKKPFVVVDESLKIKNIEAKRTKRLLAIGEQVEYKLILNGTPLSRNLLDLYPQMQFLSPKILKMTLPQFKNTFCNYTTIRKSDGWRSYEKEIITSYENIDYLYSLIRPYIYECNLELNIAQSYLQVLYDIDDESRAEYERIKRKYLDLDMLMMRNNNIFFAMTQELQHSYCLTENKFKRIDNILKDVPQKDVIIFCKFIDTQEECKRRYPEALVLSYQKEAYGLNLQQYRHTIYFDKIWDYALLTQSERRTYRTGQLSDCQYYDLTGYIGLETLIDRNISKKIDMTEYFKKVSKEQLEEEL